MKVRLNRTDLTEAISDYIRKKGLNSDVKRIEYVGPYGVFLDDLDAVVELEKEAE
ncbi:hypothetical protein HPX95_19800 [Bacillus tequilensis]|uniref:hypothetical protein n=1 Tax=Bacillus tequilensis TaxID=227866 RepID=UPI00157727F4|nr:hypothetical protein [Bacillus tequilensis]NTU28383.1 hypothetical protein [Bacillus tequilensis]